MNHTLKRSDRWHRLPHTLRGDTARSLENVGDWSVVQVKYLAAMKSGESITSEDIRENGDYPVYGGNGLRGFTSDFTHSGEYILVGRQGALCGNVHRVSGEFWASEHAVVATPNQRADADWLAYLLDAMQLNQFSMSAAQPGLAVDQIRSLWAPVPPRSTQRAIANFLDQKTAAVDELIAKKERLIELLEEKRAALINRAVTRGLNPGVPMKNGNSRFFPELPRGWRMTRVKFLTSDIADGPHFSPPYIDDEDEGVMFISARNVKVDRWQFEDAKFITRELYKELCARIRPRKGDVLYTKGGTTGVARAVDFERPFHVWVHVAVLRPRPRFVAPEYLAYALNSPGCYAQSQLYTRGATNQDLGLTRMTEIHLPLPPREKQDELVDWLDKKTNTINRTKAKTAEQIERLTEFRQSLIAAAVTGQIEVIADQHDQESSRVMYLV